MRRDASSFRAGESARVPLMTTVAGTHMDLAWCKQQLYRVPQLQETNYEKLVMATAAVLGQKICLPTYAAAR